MTVLIRALGLFLLGTSLTVLALALGALAAVFLLGLLLS